MAGVLNVDMDLVAAPTYDSCPYQPNRRAFWRSAIEEVYTPHESLWRLFDMVNPRHVMTTYRVAQYDEHVYRILTTYEFILTPPEMIALLPYYEEDVFYRLER